jgi:hypothetical protein
MAEEDVEEVVDVRVRGEAGEYHHWESLRRSNSGGRSGGSLDHTDVSASGWDVSETRMYSPICQSSDWRRHDPRLTSGSSEPLRSTRRPSHRCQGLYAEVFSNMYATSYDRNVKSSARFPYG